VCVVVVNHEEETVTLQMMAKVFAVQGVQGVSRPGGANLPEEGVSLRQEKSKSNNNNNIHPRLVHQYSNLTSPLVNSHR